MASSGESLPRVAYVEGASSREMDVAAYVAYQNNGGRKPKAPASMKSAASAASLLSSTTVAALSSKDAVAPPMSPPASKSVEDGFGQPIENQNKRYSRKCMLWFALATVVACCIGAGLGVGLGLYLPRPAGADRANAATDISGGSAGNGVVTSTRSSFPSATSAATPSIVPGECSNYTFTNGALLSSSSTSSTSSRVLARLEPEDDGRPLLGFSIEWGVDYPTNLTSRLGGKPPAIIGGFAHLINDTYWEQNIIDWYAWQVAMGAFTNYNASNPGTGYAGADHPPPIMLLALMPGFDLAQLKESTVQGIAEQMARINREWGIPIMLRFGHEMNGNWNYYSQRPLSYVAGFRRIAAAVRALTNQTAMVWAPNFGAGYPYNSPTTFTPPIYSAEWNATDTNKDGKLDGKDDPYTPFWPGSEYVDWIGMSAYWLSYAWPYGVNEETPPGYLESIINGTNYEAKKHEQPEWDIYEMFCKRYSKPFMLPESGAAFYLDYTHRTSTGAMETYEAPPGPGELKLKETWWNQAWNKENAKRWPLLKAIVNFEESKLDERGNTTYELTFDPRIRATFLRDIEASGVDPIWLEDVKGYGCDGRIGLKN